MKCLIQLVMQWYHMMVEMVIITITSITITTIIATNRVEQQIEVRFLVLFCKQIVENLIFSFKFSNLSSSCPFFIEFFTLQIASQNAVSTLTNAAGQFALTSTTTTSSSNFALPMTGTAS